MPYALVSMCKYKKKTKNKTMFYFLKMALTGMKLIPCFGVYGVIKGNNEYKSWKYKYQVALSDANK